MWLQWRKPVGSRYSEYDLHCYAFPKTQCLLHPRPGVFPLATAAGAKHYSKLKTNYSKHILQQTVVLNRWACLLKMSLIFIMETSVWDIGMEHPTSHPATGTAALAKFAGQPVWPPSVNDSG